MFPPILQPSNRALQFARQRPEPESPRGIPSLCSRIRRPGAAPSREPVQSYAECTRQNRTQHLRKLRAAFHVQPLAIVDELRRSRRAFRGEPRSACEIQSACESPDRLRARRNRRCRPLASLDKRHSFPVPDTAKARRHLLPPYGRLPAGALRNRSRREQPRLPRGSDLPLRPAPPAAPRIEPDPWR